MPRGKLELLLVSARSLMSADLFSKSDPYVIISCGNQRKKSNVASNQGSNPTWNQKFEFYVEDGITELLLEVMDEDSVSADDELGLVTVPLDDAFNCGKITLKPYSVVLKDGRFKGEVKLSLLFTPE